MMNLSTVYIVAFSSIITAMTSSRKMISPHVAPDRTITKFTQPYSENHTPYQRINYHTKVRSACQQGQYNGVLRLGKVVLVGDIAVGKTSLVNRFCHDIFERDYKATIGVDFEVEKFSILSVPFNLQIWDTAGQERFKCIAASYYRGAHAVVTVFDMSNTTSLENCRRWMVDACENADQPLKFLLGTKTDLLSEQVFLEMELRGKELAGHLQAEYWSCSSKTRENVKEFFFRLASLTFETTMLKELEPSAQSRQIGSSLIVSDEDEMYEKKDNPLSCCS